MMYVTVVYVPDSRSENGSLACFVSDNKDKSIAQAISARRLWGRNGRPYRLVTGTLDEEVVEKAQYKIKKWRNPLTDQDQP